MTAFPSPLAPLPGSAAGQVVVPAGLQSAWSTPKRLRAFRWLAWGLTAVLFLFGESTLSRSRGAFKTIDKDTVPSIISAQEIGYALADLDANVANSLLGNAQHRKAATAAIEKQRIKVTDALVDAAQNITYGDAEKIPIINMMRDLGVYLQRVAEARMRFEQGDEAAARFSYWQASDLLHAKLLVEASNLDSANKVQLDAAYHSGLRATGGSEIVTIFLGGLLGAALLALELFLYAKTRRLLNGPLLVATGLTAILAVFLAHRFTTAGDSLRVAKEDAFDSIHSLVRARTIAFDANGDESRYLLDMSPARGFDAAFKKKVAILSTQPLAKTPSPSDLEARKRAAAHGSKPTVTGLLWDELDNITFEGEFAVGTAMMEAFRQYMTIDGRIRKLASSGKMPDAVELCIGDKPDESNAAFDRFDANLQATLDLNREAFDREMNKTSHDLRVAEIVSALLAFAIAYLTWLGLRPRLHEYEA